MRITRQTGACRAEDCAEDVMPNGSTGLCRDHDPDEYARLLEERADALRKDFRLRAEGEFR